MKKEIMEKLIALITTAFGLVAALAWNSAIQAIFAKYYQLLLIIQLHKIMKPIIEFFNCIWSQ